VSVRRAEADPADASRYPYDPVCAWGRLANGKGMLVRCITHEEATNLAKNKPLVPVPGKPTTPEASASTSATPDAPAADANVVASIAGVSADQGQLPLAAKKLSVARDKFAECVKNNGGLSHASGEVKVRFLVRGRGRAEGVSVQKRVGVSSPGARCVANVVDRRFVGVPESPLVGASVTVKFRTNP
jgi:hypothetical protein